MHKAPEPSDSMDIKVNSTGETGELLTPGPPAVTANRLRLLSYNIQVGIHSQAYRHYITRGWQHILPHPRRVKNLTRLAGLLSHFDIVALQETDGGSIRTGNMNQVKFLAETAGFPYWYQQLNRNLGALAKHGNGVLCRLKPHLLEDHALPGLFPGRGAIALQFGQGKNSLLLVALHLSLGSKARNNQLQYIMDLIQDYKHVILMGDLNTQAEKLFKLSPLRGADLHSPRGTFHTFPSWRPKLHLDHILVSPSLTIKSAEVIQYQGSDHLPIAMEVELPHSISAMR